MPLALGTNADHYTGAIELANTLLKDGMGIGQVIYVPQLDVDFGDADAIAVSLKSLMATVADPMGNPLRN
jgi:3-dehydrotetronate 4-kinase